MLSACGSPEAESIVFNKRNLGYPRNATKKILSKYFKKPPHKFTEAISFPIESNARLQEVFAHTIKEVYLTAAKYLHIYERHVLGKPVIDSYHPERSQLPALFVPGTNFEVFKGIIRILLTQESYKHEKKRVENRPDLRLSVEILDTIETDTDTSLYISTPDIVNLLLPSETSKKIKAYFEKNDFLVNDLKFSAIIKIGRDIRKYYLILDMNKHDRVEIISVFPDYHPFNISDHPEAIVYDLNHHTQITEGIAKLYSDYTREDDKSNQPPPAPKPVKKAKSVKKSPSNYKKR